MTCLRPCIEMNWDVCREFRLRSISTLMPLLKFCRARKVPFVLQHKVNQELECLEKLGISEPVHFSEWTAPVVPLVKNDGSIRLCGDYKLIINRAAQLDS